MISGWGFTCFRRSALQPGRPAGFRGSRRGRSLHRLATILFLSTAEPTSASVITQKANIVVLVLGTDHERHTGEFRLDYLRSQDLIRRTSVIQNRAVGWRA